MCIATIVGRDATFFSIAEHLTHWGSEKTVCMWYAAHPRTLLSVISVPSFERRAGRRFPSLDHTGRVKVELHVSRNGVKMNASPVPERLRAVVAQLSLLSTLTSSPSRLYITSTEVQTLRRLFIFLQDGPHLSPLVDIARLRTTEFAVLLGCHKRLTGRVLEPIRSVEHLVLEGSRSVDAKLTGVHELGRLSCLDMARVQVFSLSPLRMVQTLSDIDVSSTEITNADVAVLGQLLRLRRLILDNCRGLTSLVPLVDHPSLRHLSAVRCIHLRLVRTLTTIVTLEYVDLSCTGATLPELMYCVKGFVAVRTLSLNELTLGDVHRDCICSSQELRTLSLKKTTTGGFEWVAAARFLKELLLDGTVVNEKQLVRLCGSLLYLESISVVGCLLLLTSLSFALPMQHLKWAALSCHSLAAENVVSLLRESGVTCVIV